ncbi:hypothetical protein RGU70_05715 [Herbaspirillum sp. RTI4]|uniref:hypothetical protein n=1 Tax=Herbaspirillum sp. RTI4 TaxID=3048640 RepID=UPI002AB4B425|nr:hypothetical protein [Herbaspirillum sp. RTI4]MDY7577815.1 hypothetical protein [Herbaspirillum sp. RTI4]MEA9983433.1 hypothetical protein [Herbaspirillum sp. RTI4]
MRKKIFRQAHAPQPGKVQYKIEVRVVLTAQLSLIAPNITADKTVLSGQEKAKPLQISALNMHVKKQSRLLQLSVKAAGLLCASIVLLAAPSVDAAALLSCDVTYAGATQTIQTGIRNDPYAIASVDIGGRFRFKAVMIGGAGQIDYIKLYAYFQTDHGDLPIQEVRFEPPFLLSKTAQSLGPQTMLYAGPLERELQYRCNLKDE